MLHFPGFLCAMQQKRHVPEFSCSMQLKMIQFPEFLREQHTGTDRPIQKGPQSPVDISELKSKLFPGDFQVEIEMTYFWKLLPEKFIIE